jgi:hypothetical protein
MKSLALCGVDFVTLVICKLSNDFLFLSLFSCVNRKGSDLGFGGVGREFIQTDCAINQVSFFSNYQFTNQIQTLLSQQFLLQNLSNKICYEYAFREILEDLLLI